MNTLARTALAMAIAATVLVTPVSASAVEDFERVARLNSNGPGVTRPEGDGRGRAVLAPYPGERKICWRFRYERMEVRGLNLYRRSTGEQVAELYDEAPTTVGRLRGCTTIGKSDYYELTSRRVREVKRHPGRFSVLAYTYSGEQIAGRLRRPPS